MQRPTGLLPRSLFFFVTLAVLAASTAVTPAIAQAPITGIKTPPVETRQFGDLAEGPYNRLVIQNVNVLPGHGGPSVGLYDILVEGNVITEMRRFDPYMPAEEREHIDGDRVIDGTGKWVMPGMINLHLHLRNEPLPLEYVYYLQLATGITTLGPRGRLPSWARIVEWGCCGVAPDSGCTGGPHPHLITRASGEEKGTRSQIAGLGPRLRS